MRNALGLTVTSRPIPNTHYREHSLTLDGVEIAVQLNSFTPQEIEQAVYMYRTHGITAERHRCSRWADVEVAAIPADGVKRPQQNIPYNGPYLED